MFGLDIGAVLRPDLALLGRHPELYGYAPGSRSLRLADALGCGPVWAEFGNRFALAVRTEPDPIIAVLGTPSREDGPRLRALGWQVRDCIERLSPVDLSRTLRLCEVLSERLRERVGDELDAAIVVGVPRGGLIVAGFLAQLLNLDVQDPLSASPADARELLLVVDDCAFSGARLRRWLMHHPHPRVVVAHLHSSPELRAAVERDERVAACVAAEDIGDWAPTVYAEGYDAWLARWRERSPDDYWTGHPDFVAYIWNEPETLLWNEVTGHAEVGWRVVPPQWCLKNRAARFALPQVCRPAQGPLQPERGVVWARFGERVVVADAASGSAAVLSDVAAASWLAVVATGERDAAARAVADGYGQPVERVGEDLDGFVSDCIQRGLLQRSADG